MRIIVSRMCIILKDEELFNLDANLDKFNYTQLA